ncbi:ATP/GTP-binding protein [Streptomyces sp. NBC_01476]|uniref:GTP-binding protein n=1 Tax=Streptomyces sp. NBC_01476 TaxID=2903881 RepID=UPI002E37A806|nr:ATP/GTP-binding protein [Streptomyces sp. NBC_01476]
MTPEPLAGGVAQQTATRPPMPVKMVIAGGFGVGKTTTVRSISEIVPLTTEADITEVAAGVDDLTHTPDKTTTTVAMDFGCITIDEALKLYLFGTPGQERFGFMWDDLVEGAIGGLVIVDTRRLDDCHAAVDYFEHKEIPFAVAVNAFDGRIQHELDEVRWALDVADQVPVIAFDARERGSVRDALLVVLELALSRVEG